MQDLFNEIVQVLSANVPKLLGALAILVVGWLIAVVVSALLRTGLRRLELDQRLARLAVAEERPKGISVERVITKSVFYLIMLFVLVAFFQVLGPTLATEPMNNLVNRLFEFAPRLVGAALLLLVAWVVASLLRMIILKVLTAAKLDERLGERAGAKAERPIPMVKTLSEAVYWLVFLFFLPAILDALRLEGLLLPVQDMVGKILGYLPSILLAALILVVGWFLARIAQRIAANLLAAAGADRLSEKIGMAPMLGTLQLSGLLGLVVYILILIPVLIAALDALGLEAITRPASSMLDSVLTTIPSIFAAVLLLVVAYFIGRVVARLAANLLAGAGFNGLVTRLGLAKEPPKGERAPSDIVGYLVLVAIMLFAGIEALNLVGFELLAGLVSRFMVFAGHLIVGLIVFAVGLYLANLASKTILASKAAQAGMLALAARISIIVLAAAMALRQMELANEIITLAFGVALGAVALGLAIAFGLGGRDLAGRALDDWYQSIKTKKS
jgi:hypothetical protein